MALSLTSLAITSFAAEPHASDDLSLASDTIRARLKISRPEIAVLEVKQSAIPGLYEVTLDIGQTFIFTADGRHFIAGDLYEVKDRGLVNISENSRTNERRQIIAGLDESEMIIFSPRKELVKATLTVFTDIDCVYCRKLHNEVPELNRLGIAVRYLAYPRKGLHSESYDKFVSAWCADSPRMALTKAKMGEDISPKVCQNPIAAQYDLGSRLGVNSTPSLIFEDGTLQPGYAPAKTLAARLGVL